MSIFRIANHQGILPANIYYFSFATEIYVKKPPLFLSPQLLRQVIPSPL